MLDRPALKGISTLEVLVAMSLFGLIMTSASSVFIVAMTGRAMSGDLGHAMRLAQEEMETLRNRQFVDVTCPGGTYGSCPDKTVTRGSKTFTIKTTILNNTPVTGARQMKITVKWATPRGTRQYVVENIFAF